MASEGVSRNREWFQKELEQTASRKAIPIQHLSWRDVSNQDASDLIVESGGKKRVFTLEHSDMTKDAQGQIELIVNQIIDNE